MLDAYAPVKALRDKGWTYEAIGAELGMTKNAAIGLVWRVRNMEGNHA